MKMEIKVTKIMILSDNVVVIYQHGSRVYVVGYGVLFEKKH